jgi:flavin-dependent dehydrogenase
MRPTGAQYDVIIAGAGPAGSSAAVRLAEAGLNVLLIEQKTFPREKLCGEFISPECLSHFAELKVLDEMRLGAATIDRTVFYARSGRAVAVPSEWFAVSSYAIGLSRAMMDARLLGRARAAGAEVRQETHVTGLLMNKGKVLGLRVRDINGHAIELTSRLVIDATGRGRLLAREIEKLGGKTSRRADYVAFKVHLENTAIRPLDCEIYAYRGGYGGCSRVENGLNNLCFIVSAKLAKQYHSDAGEIMRNVLFGNRRAADALKNARVANEWLAVPIESYGRADLAPVEGLLAIGDAAAFIDPFTGSGILLALESAKVASQVIAVKLLGPFASLAAEYERRYRSAFDRRLRVSSLVRHATFAPFFAEMVIRTLSLSDALTRRLARATRPSAPAREA